MNTKTLKQIICLIAFSIVLFSCNNYSLKVKVEHPLAARDSSEPMYIYFEKQHDLPDSAKLIGSFVLEYYGMESIYYAGDKNYSQIIKIFDDNFLNIGANCLYMDAPPYKNKRSFFEGKMYQIPNFDDTPYSEKDLIEKWTGKELDAIEGIYETSMEDFGFYYIDKYFKYAVVRQDSSRYLMIYLSGFESLPDNVGFLKVKKMWKEGDIMSYIEKTNNPLIFKTQTYEFNKALLKNCILKYDEGNIRLYKKTSLDWYRKIFPFKAKKENFVSSLTGFSINHNEILTCYHGVKDTSAYIYVKGINGNFDKKYLAKLVDFNKELDLAIIRIMDSTQISLSNELCFTLEQKNTADEIYVLGYPVSTYLGDEIKLTNGIINSTSGYAGDVDSYQFSAPIQPGNSGSPLLDKKGNLIGIVNSGITAAANVGYALKMQRVNEFIKAKHISWQVKDENSLDKLSLADQLKKIKNNILLIEIFESDEKAKERMKLRRRTF